MRSGYKQPRSGRARQGKRWRASAPGRRSRTWRVLVATRRTSRISVVHTDSSRAASSDGEGPPPKPAAAPGAPAVEAVAMTNGFCSTSPLPPLPPAAPTDAFPPPPLKFASSPKISSIWSSPSMVTSFSSAIAFVWQTSRCRTSRASVRQRSSPPGLSRSRARTRDLACGLVWRAAVACARRPGAER